MKITKKNLTEKIYKKYLKTYPAVKQIRKQDVQAIVDIFVQTMAEDLLQGNSIELRGFGIFERKIQKARTWAKDPRNGNYLNLFGPTYLEPVLSIVGEYV